MFVDTTLECGHQFALALPDHVFSRGVVIFPCPKCGAEYSVRVNGEIAPYNSKPFRFLAMHC